MRRRIFHAPRPFGDINVTPLIDVVMCMIVFYLIAGKLAADQRSPMRLPESRHGVASSAQNLLVINIGAGEGGTPAYEVDQTSLDTAALTVLVRARAEERPGTVVQIRAPRSLRYDAVKPAIDACRDAGLATVRLATENVP